MTEFFWVLGVIWRAYFSNNPTDSLYNEISGYDFFDKLKHLDDDFLAKVLVVMVVLVDQSQEIVEDIFRQVLTSQLK